MPDSFFTPEFWITLLSLLGVSKLVEVTYTRFLNRRQSQVEYGMSSLKFMVHRMEAMENEMTRQKDEIRALKGEVKKMKAEYEKLSETLHSVTAVVEEHASEDVIERVRQIPGVPTVIRVV